MVYTMSYHIFSIENLFRSKSRLKKKWSAETTTLQNNYTVSNEPNHCAKRLKRADYSYFKA